MKREHPLKTIDNSQLLYGHMATQQVIKEWCDYHFPGTTSQEAYIALIEEVVELGVEMQMPLDDILKAATVSWRKSEDKKRQGESRGQFAEEIADVAINLAHFASKMSQLVQVCVNRKMDKLRDRPISESLRRVAAKRAMGLNL